MIRLKLTAIDTSPALLLDNQIGLSFDALDDANVILVSVTFAVNAGSNTEQILSRAWDEAGRAWSRKRQLTRLQALIGSIVDRRDDL